MIVDETGPIGIVATVIAGVEGELPIRPADRYRIALVANAKVHRFGQKGSRRFAGPIQPLPVYRMKMLVTPLYDGVDTQIVLLKISRPPSVGIGSATILVPGTIDPVVDDVVDAIVIAQSNGCVLQALKAG